MSSLVRSRILCVDDEPNVLEGLRRTLSRGYEVVTAVGPEEGMRELEQSGLFAAIVSDLRMPGMDGITFLERARDACPDAVRVLLTGNADLGSALEAVNRGAVFRFLLKPCAAETLQQAVSAAVEQHRLVTAERTLLEQTLHGSIQALTEVLALINPAGFGRAVRARALAGELAARLGFEPRWQIEVAALLSQIGMVSLSPETAEKVFGGKPLTYAEEVCVERLPRVASDLLGNIPRLEVVREILFCQNLRFSEEAKIGGRPAGEQIPAGARLLKLVLDFDLLEEQGLPRPRALETLRSRSGWYDPSLLTALSEYCEGEDSEQHSVEMELCAVRAGMIFVDDVVTDTGVLLVARGMRVSEGLVSRIHNFAHLPEARQRVRVAIREEPLSAAHPHA